MTATLPTAPASQYDRVASASSAVVIQGYSTSFGWACRLLAEPVRSQVRNVYALVRLADEVVDEPFDAWTTDQRRAVLDRLEADTYDAMRTGRSANLVVHAFAGTANRAGIGADLVRPFFASMRTDLSVRVHDRESFTAYVYGSAEVVGLMCLRVFTGGDDAQYDRLAPAASRLGAAFQKLNFLRDIAEDHGVRGRRYFPDLDPDGFTDRERDAILADIDEDLAAAASALPHLPPSSRRGVAAAHALFTELAGRLRATPASRIRAERVRVPGPVKAAVVARTVLAGGRG